MYAHLLQGLTHDVSHVLAKHECVVPEDFDNDNVVDLFNGPMTTHKHFAVLTIHKLHLETLTTREVKQICPKLNQKINAFALTLGKRMQQFYFDRNHQKTTRLAKLLNMDISLEHLNEIKTLFPKIMTDLVVRQQVINWCKRLSVEMFRIFWQFNDKLYDACEKGMPLFLETLRNLPLETSEAKGARYIILKSFAELDVVYFSRNIFEKCLDMFPPMFSAHEEYERCVAECFMAITQALSERMVNYIFPSDIKSITMYGSLRSAAEDLYWKNDDATKLLFEMVRYTNAYEAHTNKNKTEKAKIRDEKLQITQQHELLSAIKRRQRRAEDITSKHTTPKKVKKNAAKLAAAEPCKLLEQFESVNVASENTEDVVIETFPQKLLEQFDSVDAVPEKTPRKIEYLNDCDENEEKTQCNDQMFNGYETPTQQHMFEYLCDSLNDAQKNETLETDVSALHEPTIENTFVASENVFMPDNYKPNVTKTDIVESNAVYDDSIILSNEFQVANDSMQQDAQIRDEDTFDNFEAIDNDDVINCNDDVYDNLFQDNNDTDKEVTFDDIKFDDNAYDQMDMFEPFQDVTFDEQKTDIAEVANETTDEIADDTRAKVTFETTDEITEDVTDETSVANETTDEVADDAHVSVVDDPDEVADDAHVSFVDEPDVFDDNDPCDNPATEFEELTNIFNEIQNDIELETGDAQDCDEMNFDFDKVAQFDSLDEDVFVPTQSVKLENDDLQFQEV